GWWTAGSSARTVGPRRTASNWSWTSRQPRTGPPPAPGRRWTPAPPRTWPGGWRRSPRPAGPRCRPTPPSACPTKGAEPRRGPGGSGQEAAEQGARALQVLGHRAAGPVRVAGQDRGHDGGVLGRGVVDVAGQHRDRVEQVVGPHAGVRAGRG